MMEYAVEAKSRKEFEEYLKKNDLVIVEIRNRDSYESRYLSRILGSIIEPVSHKIKAVFVDHSRAHEVIPGYNESKYIPSVRLYLKGNMVWEQEGVFVNENADRLAIKRGIREVLRSYGIILRI